MKNQLFTASFGKIVFAFMLLIGSFLLSAPAFSADCSALDAEAKTAAEMYQTMATKCIMLSMMGSSCGGMLDYAWANLQTASDAAYKCHHS